MIASKTSSVKWMGKWLFDSPIKGYVGIMVTDGSLMILGANNIESKIIYPPLRRLLTPN